MFSSFFDTRFLGSLVGEKLGIFVVASVAVAEREFPGGWAASTDHRRIMFQKGKIEKKVGEAWGTVAAMLGYSFWDTSFLYMFFPCWKYLISKITEKADKKKRSAADSDDTCKHLLGH